MGAGGGGREGREPARAGSTPGRSAAGLSVATGLQGSGDVRAGLGGTCSVSLRLLRILESGSKQSPRVGVPSLPPSPCDAFGEGDKGRAVLLYLSMHQQADCQGHVQPTF